MLKSRIIVAALILTLTSSVAFAQAAAGPAGPGGAGGGAAGGSSSGGSGPPTPGTPPGAPPPAITPATERGPTRAQIKTEREACFKEAQGAQLTGEARRTSIQKCMDTKFPMLAKRRDCAQQGRAKGLKHRKLRRFIQSCVH
ncbi:MAG: hypothetical protein KGQ46_11985 [Hyphomicrobiales bacterium]|nr:hypothetical protein [Hyphomicrobiales bacterium]MDE2115264.1 hypothetical protein [Hyphomicrobiales bacterium]